MAAKTQRIARNKMPGVGAHCQVVDARYIPFQNGVFDAVASCYLLELPAEADMVRPGGRMALVLIGQQTPAFNAWYRLISRFRHGDWGFYVGLRVPDGA